MCCAKNSFRFFKAELRAKKPALQRPYSSLRVFAIVVKPISNYLKSDQIDYQGARTG